MTQILLITSSPRGDASHSTKVAKALLAELMAKTPGATLVTRDVGANPPPHLTPASIGARFTPAEHRSPEAAASVAASEAMAHELLAADIIIIASAMINFGVTAALKTWIDHVALAGITFRYTAEGKPEGLVTGKTVYLIEARGGMYGEEPMKALNMQEPYLLVMLGFLGMTNVKTLAIEGIAYGPEMAEKSVAGALAQVPALAA